MSSKLEPAIWSCDTGQRIPCFDRCQLTVTQMSNIKEGRYKSRVNVSVNLLAGVWPPSCMTPSLPLPLRVHPQSIPLAMITMGKSIHGFPFLFYVGIGLCLVALLAAGATLLTSQSDSKLWF